MDKQNERLRKSERLCSKKRIDLLFGTGGSHAMTAFPLKAVYRLTDSVPASSSPDGDPETASVQMMVSVPKRHFRRAVKRNSRYVKPTASTSTPSSGTWTDRPGSSF